MPPEMWSAPVATDPVRGTVQVPGSKSVANRALLLSCLADGESTISGLPLQARDIKLMIAALRALGFGIEQLSDPAARAVRVTPQPISAPATVECGLAGTVMRFLPPIAGLADGEVRFDGDAEARTRPMTEMLTALTRLGIDIDDGGRGSLPFTVIGHGEVAGGTVDIDSAASSQFVTALLLCGAKFSNGVQVRHRGGKVPSLPHIRMTCQMLAQHGVAVAENLQDRHRADWTVTPGTVQALDRVVEPDLSNALPLAAAAVVTGGEVTIADWPVNSLQPGGEVIELLEQLGATTESVADGLLVRGTGRIRGINLDMRDIGELVPTVAAICALADSPSTLSGIGHIAGHETNRLAALAAEINGLGGDVTATDDELLIKPRPLHSGSWATYRDHRMATAGAIIGLVTPEVLVEDIATTGKTFAEFPQVWETLVNPAAEAVGRP